MGSQRGAVDIAKSARCRLSGAPSGGAQQLDRADHLDRDPGLVLGHAGEGVAVKNWCRVVEDDKLAHAWSIASAWRAIS
jgi:hypothetical protein